MSKWTRRADRIRADIRSTLVPALSDGSKRALDTLVALIGLVLLIPLFAAIALVIRGQDGGPILFWQRRVGRGGRIFSFPKFRSMVVGAETQQAQLLGSSHHDGGVTFKIRRDPRVTPFGRLLRKLSLDELPQLWCVFTGTMSLVGPRPPIPSEVARYSPRARRRLDIRPGLTCTWQVSGRADIPFPKQVEMDLAYIHGRSLGNDLRLLLQTVPAVVTGRGAY